MPSIQESKARVKASLAGFSSEIDHDAILASLQSEIDQHNAANADASRRRRDGAQADMRFRFKRRSRSPRGERPHRTRERDDARPTRRKHHHRANSTRQEDTASQGGTATDTAHPLPRRLADPDQSGPTDPSAAFRESLFDALADDEGAAYWEGVYSQPIHIYARPTVETASGELEQMNDDDYAAYVQTKMWEKKHPHVAEERERKKRDRKKAEEDRTREKEEYVRRKQRAAWERAQRHGARKFTAAGTDDDEAASPPRYEYVFDDPSGGVASRRADMAQQTDEYREAWEQYMAAWELLKRELLDTAGGDHDDSGSREASRRIPWPVLRSKPVVRPNIEAFMRHLPAGPGGRTRVQMLKAERVRWHPDKIQQRFGGHVDEGTMKTVTGVFQVVDSLLDEERKVAP